MDYKRRKKLQIKNIRNSVQRDAAHFNMSSNEFSGQNGLVVFLNEMLVRHLRIIRFR